MKYFITRNPIMDNSLFDDSNYQIRYNVTSLLKWLDWLERTTQGYIYSGFDVETEGLFDHSNKLLCIQIGNQEDQFVIDWQSFTGNDLIELKTQLQNRYFYNQRHVKIGHNLKFDVKFLWKEGIAIRSIFDTMAARALLTAGFDVIRGQGFYSLKTCLKETLNIEMDKEIRNAIKRLGWTKAVIDYCAKDVEHLVPLALIYFAKLRAYQMANNDCQDEYTVLGLENKSLLSFASMEFVGVRPDPNQLKDVGSKLHFELLSIDEQLTNCVKDDPNFGINVGNNLFGKADLGIKWSSAAQKKALLKRIFPDIEGTSKDVLNKLKNDHPIIKPMIEYNKINKLLSSFSYSLLKFVNPKTGRIHTNIWPYLKTGRISMNEPNMQQIPSRGDWAKPIRKCFIAADGNALVGSDYGQCELRFIAEFSQDPAWLNIFLNNQDLHTELCKKVFNITDSEVKSQCPYKDGWTYRDVIKVVNFGLAYGMSEHKLAATLEISTEAALEIIDTYFRACPKVKSYLDRQGNFAAMNGYAMTGLPYQRRRFFKGYGNLYDRKRWGQISRAGKNHPIQGSNADLIKLALIRLYESMEERISLVLQIHDEIISDVVKSKASDWAVHKGHVMSECGKVMVNSIPMASDPWESPHWIKG